MATSDPHAATVGIKRNEADMQCFSLSDHPLSVECPLRCSKARLAPFLSPD